LVEQLAVGQNSYLAILFMATKNLAQYLAVTEQTSSLPTLLILLRP